MQTSLIGYFDSASNVPAYDPGKDVICPVCEKPLSEPINAHSFMGEDGMRSYFIRTHAHCDPDELIGTIIDEVIGR